MDVIRKLLLDVPGIIENTAAVGFSPATIVTGLLFDMSLRPARAAGVLRVNQATK
jgi:hypothetical protein